MISGTEGLDEWKNCEVRQYTFKSADDEEADIIRIKAEAEAEAGPGPASCEQATSQ